MRGKNLLACLVPLFILSACSSIPKEIRKDAVEATFREVMEDAAAYTGKTVVWGGYILKTENRQDQTRILILQSPLTSRDEPQGKDRSEGRFVAVFDKFLDPEIYEEGRMITVAGKVMEQEPTRIGKYRYPLIKINGEYIKLWSIAVERPGYYYGPGPYYDPFYDPFYDPYWPGPFYRRHLGPYPYYR